MLYEKVVTSREEETTATKKKRLQITAVLACSWTGTSIAWCLF